MSRPRGASGHPAVMAGRSARLPDAAAPLLDRVRADGPSEGGGMADRPSGFTAVMAGRATVDPDALDYFPTPPWAARAGAEIVRALDPAARSVWEPACGGGHMALPLMEYFRNVVFSDVHDHGGALSPLQHIGDFLDPDFGTEVQADWIITNPPFVHGAAFAAEGLMRARRGVALLLRTAFVESAKRYPLMAALTLHAPFSERVPMVKGRWDPEASSATAYSWFVWMRADAVDESPAHDAIRASAEIGAHLERLIPPGTKARLWRREDVARFAAGSAAPLLESVP